jgi:hypothetical protein
MNFKEFINSLHPEVLDKEEKEYWLNLSEVMNDDQKTRFIDILELESNKLKEIDKKLVRTQNNKDKLRKQFN